MKNCHIYCWRFLQMPPPHTLKRCAAALTDACLLIQQQTYTFADWWTLRSIGMIISPHSIVYDIKFHPVVSDKFYLFLLNNKMSVHLKVTNVGLMIFFFWTQMFVAVEKDLSLVVWKDNNIIYNICNNNNILLLRWIWHQQIILKGQTTDSFENWLPCDL